MTDVTVVTVTYAERSHLCIPVLEAVMAQGVKQAVVVLNGVAESSSRAIYDFSKSFSERVVIVDNGENVGTAIAFARGMQIARERFVQGYIWLLDDDNMPRPDCLTQLLGAIRAKNRDTAVAALRSALSEHVRAAHCGNADFYPSHSSFLSFDVIQRLRQHWGHGEPGSTDGGFPIPYAPYGGLLFPMSMLDTTGLPRADFVLYEDDTDFTSRIVMSGKTLLLVPSAVIDDIDQNWIANSECRRRGPGRMVKARSPLRLYYATRNRVFLDVRRQGGNKGLKCLNVIIFTVMLCVSCRRIDDLRALVTIFTAMLHGFRGQLGRNPNFDILTLGA